MDRKTQVLFCPNFSHFFPFPVKRAGRLTLKCIQFHESKIESVNRKRSRVNTLVKFQYRPILQTVIYIREIGSEV